VTLPLDAVPPGSGWDVHYGARLELLRAVARDSGRIDGATAAAVGRVVERIGELAGPVEPPARVHGDLWSGNVHAGADGRHWLIDPAAHGAHRELDLAMLRLFGTISARTLAAYEELEPLAAGHEGRVALWQLQPLLVHAILFGGSYGASVGRAAGLYA
jgi:fructosamine-3-kinase